MDNRHFGGPRPLPGCRPSFGDLEFSAAEINELLKRLIKMQDVEGLVSGVNIVNIENHELLQPGNLTLEDLGAARLANMNDVYVPWQGSAYATRNYLPALLRRKGISISYVTDKGIAVKERAVSDVGIDNANWGLDSNWMRVDELSLNGKLYVSPNGTWVINGVDSGIQALGPKGDNGLTPRLKTIDNKLHYSYDGNIWNDAGGDHIAAWFRWSGNKIQISRDNRTWKDFSGEFADNLFIKGYVATFDKLPADAVQGDIWGVGPRYAAEDTEQTQPIYRYWVRNAGGWVDNGEFTSIVAGIVQETGDGEGVVMSQKAVTEKLSVMKSFFSEPNIRIDVELQRGSYYNQKGTQQVDASLMWSSAKIDISAFVNNKVFIKTKGNGAYNVVLDENDLMIGSYDTDLDGNAYTIILPSNAKYLGISNHNGSNPNDNVEIVANIVSISDSREVDRLINTRLQLDKSVLYLNGYINEKGIFTPYSAGTFKASNFIGIESYKYIKVTSDNTSGHSISFYEEEDETTFVGTMEYTTFAYNQILDIPTNAKYIRFSNGINKVVNITLFRSTDIDVLAEKLEVDNNVIFTGTDCVNDGYVNEKGEVVNTTYYKSTEYLYIGDVVNMVITTNNTTGAGIAFYSKCDVYSLVGFVEYNQQSGVAIDIPAGANYMRFCNYHMGGKQISIECTTSGNVEQRIEVVERMSEDFYTYTHNKNSFKTNILSKPYLFERDKTITFFGDSITFGVASSPSGLIDSENGYAKIFSDKLGLVMDNQAVSGSTLLHDDYEVTEPYPRTITSIYTKVMGYSQKRDYIIVAGGVNDCNRGNEVGLITQDYVSAISDNTVSGCVELMAKHLKTLSDNVIFITPINQSYVSPDAIADLDEYRRAIFEAAAKYNCDVVDGSQFCFPTNSEKRNRFGVISLFDGIHPTELGHNLYGKQLVSLLI